MVKVLFDILITGHHTEYISHLINYLYNNDDGHRYVFVVHPDFKSRFGEIASKAEQADNITLVQITDSEFSKSQQGGLVQMSFNTYKLASFYASRYKAQHLCLLYFNIFQLPLIFFRPSYSISGILFLQFYRMERGNLKEKLKYFRKYLITKSYALNPRIKRIFVLNDEETVSFLNRTLNTSIFKMLADPIPQFKPIESFDIYEHYSIEKHRKIFLHIGSLSDRKGTFELIKAASLADPQTQDEVVFLLVGKTANRQLEEKLQYDILESNKTCGIPIIWDNLFVSNEMMKSLFNQCYAVVIPYKNPEASSGILGHAAASNKMVITTGKGLLKDIVSNYGLGLLIEDVTPHLIVEQITVALKQPNLNSKAKKFVRTKTVSHFAEEIRSCL